MHLNHPIPHVIVGQMLHIAFARSLRLPGRVRQGPHLRPVPF